MAVEETCKGLGDPDEGGSSGGVASSKARDGRAERFAEQLRLTEEVLRREIGPDWRAKIDGMDRHEKLYLAMRLFECGVRNATAIAKLLRLSGRDLEKIKICYADDLSRTSPADSGDTEPPKHAGDRAKAVAMAADRELALKLRVTPIQPSKPILAKEVEDAAWFHNLCHDLGNFVYHKLAKYVEWEPEDLKDPEKAFKKLADIFNGMLELRENAKLLEDLRAERDMFEACFYAAMDTVNRLTSSLKSCEGVLELYQQTIPRLCSSCQQKLLKQLILYSLGGIS